MKLESLFQHLLHKSQCLFGLFRSLTKNHKVIGITNKPVTGMIQLPVQIVQDNICQEWGNDPTLWCADGSRFKPAIVHNPRREKLLDQTENVAISYPFSHRLHSDRMREVIEKSLNVRIYDVAEAFIMEFQSRLDRHVALPAMAVTIRGGMKQRFHDWIRIAPGHHLTPAILNGRNAERGALRLHLRAERTSMRLRL